MFDIKERIQLRMANKAGILLIPADRWDREITESMFLEGAEIRDINQFAFDSWRQRKRERVEFLGYGGGLQAVSGPLRSLRRR